MRRAEAEQRIRIAFKDAGFRFVDDLLSGIEIPPSISFMRVVTVDVEVITAAPWLGKNRCDIVFRDTAFTYAGLVRKAEAFCARRPAHTFWKGTPADE